MEGRAAQHRDLAGARLGIDGLALHQLLTKQLGLRIREAPVGGLAEVVLPGAVGRPGAVLRGEDAHADGGELLDLVGDDHATTAAVHPHLGCTLLCQAFNQVGEVLVVAPLVGGHRDCVGVLLHGCCNLVLILLG